MSKNSKTYDKQRIYKRFMHFFLNILAIRSSGLLTHTNQRKKLMLMAIATEKKLGDHLNLKFP